MDAATIVDIGAVLVILLSALLAYARGFVREGLSLASWVIAAIVGFHFADNAVPLVLEIPYVSDLLSGSCELTVLVAAFAVFVLAMILMAFFIPVIANLVQRSVLSGVDSLFGLIFGAARGVLLVLVALVAYDLVGIELDYVDQSTTYAYLNETQEKVHESIEAESKAEEGSWTQWAQNHYDDLTASCSDS